MGGGVELVGSEAEEVRQRRVEKGEKRVGYGFT